MCSSLSKTAELAQCESDYLLYMPEGCGGPWSAFLTCETAAPFTCDQGPTGCDAAQNAYFACQSKFAARTGCSRLGALDAKCGAAAPYAFGCLGAIPAGCTALPPTGGATVACCPAFGPP